MTYWVGVQSVGQKMYVIPQTEDQDYLFSSWQSWIEAGLLALSSHLEAGQWIYVFYNLFVKFSSNFLSSSVDGKKKQISLPGFVWSQETGACLGCSDLWSQQQFACCPSYSQHLHTTTITTPGLAGRSDCRLQTADCSHWFYYGKSVGGLSQGWYRTNFTVLIYSPLCFTC